MSAICRAFTWPAVAKLRANGSDEQPAGSQHLLLSAANKFWGPANFLAQWFGILVARARNQHERQLTRRMNTLIAQPVQMIYAFGPKRHRE